MRVRCCPLATAASVTLITVSWSWIACTQHHINPGVSELYCTELSCWCCVDPPRAGQVPWDGSFLWTRRGRRHECRYIPRALRRRTWYQGGHRHAGQHSPRPSTRTAHQRLSWGEHILPDTVCFPPLVYTEWTWSSHSLVVKVVDFHPVNTWIQFRCCYAIRYVGGSWKGLHSKLLLFSKSWLVQALGIEELAQSVVWPDIKGN